MLLCLLLAYEGIAAHFCELQLRVLCVCWDIEGLVCVLGHRGFGVRIGT